MVKNDRNVCGGEPEFLRGMGTSIRRYQQSLCENDDALWPNINLELGAVKLRLGSGVC